MRIKFQIPVFSDGFLSLLSAHSSFPRLPLSPQPNLGHLNKNGVLIHLPDEVPQHQAWLGDTEGGTEILGGMGWD